MNNTMTNRLLPMDIRLSQSRMIQAALYRITEISAETESMQAFYQAIHATVAELTYAENFFLALYDENKKMVQFVYFVDSVDTVDVHSLAALPVDRLRRTATGYVLRTGEILHTDIAGLKLLEKQGHIDNFGAECIDWLGLPLMYKNSVLGALVVQSYKEEYKYSRADKELLQFVSRQIALVLKRKQFEQQLQDANALLEDRVQSRTAQLEFINQNLEGEIRERKRAEKLQSVLFKITELTNTSQNLKDFFSKIHKIIGELMYSRNLYVALLDEQRNMIEFPYYQDEYVDHGKPRLLQSNQGLTERVINSGISMLYSRNSEHIFPGRGKAAESWLGVPLKDNKMTFGVLVVQSYDPQYSYSDREKTLLTFVGRHIATAILRKKDADSVAAANKKLKIINDELERRVLERTRELEATNSVLMTNIEERKSIEKQLEHDALHDNLTTLPNRVLFHDRLSHALARSSRELEPSFAVLFLDLDRFKIINDSLGHHAGDMLLNWVAKRLLECVRPKDTVSRLGGDEFSILLDGISGEKFVIEIAERIQQSLQKSIIIDEQEISSTCSIGIRLSSSQSDSPEQIMRDADAAMYQAKSRGKARFCLFDESMHAQVRDRLQMEYELKHAVKNNQLELYFQPIVNLTTCKIVSMEALLRWNHPRLEQVSPAIFIPLAEETGLILEIGARVLDLACQTLKGWEQSVLLNDLSLSVNMSPKQIALGEPLVLIEKLLQKHDVSGQKLKLEITESVLVHSFQSAKTLIDGLKNHGVEIYLDDFGTGYSSLNYLHNFPFDVLKLDQTFVQSLHLRKENMAIVKTIKLLASSLNMGTVAEGIETPEQLSTLTALGYHRGQGYLFSEPLPQSQLESFIRSFKMPG